jgi:hypothetical protein
MNRASPVVTIGWLRQPPALAGLLADVTAVALRAIPLSLPGPGMRFEPLTTGNAPIHSGDIKLNAEILRANPKILVEHLAGR